jgi:hypothetical protein
VISAAVALVARRNKVAIAGVRDRAPPPPHRCDNVAIASVVPEGAEETVVIVNPSDRQALSLTGDFTEASLMQETPALRPGRSMPAG